MEEVLAGGNGIDDGADPKQDLIYDIFGHKNMEVEEMNPIGSNMHTEAPPSAGNVWLLSSQVSRKPTMYIGDHEVSVPP